MGAAADEEDDGTTLPDDPAAAAALADAVEAAAPADACALATFSAAVARAPAQVLRYCFHADARPVWPRAAPPPPRPSAVPPCPRCGGPRAFELHILPQVLACLGRDAADPRAPDFAAAAVWSCAASCPISGDGGGSAYAEEFVWVQAGDGQE
jgi:pre-rRNA-processing protein TSR4